MHRQICLKHSLLVKLHQTCCGLVHTPACNAPADKAAPQDGTCAGGGAVPAETKVILSSHNFEDTPSDKALETILEQMWASGADVAKIATTATDITDCARVLTLLKTSQGMCRMGINSSVFAAADVMLRS